MRDLTNVSSQGSGGTLGPCHFITPLPGFTTCRNHGPDDPRCVMSSPDFVLIESSAPGRATPTEEKENG